MIKPFFYLRYIFLLAFIALCGKNFAAQEERRYIDSLKAVLSADKTDNRQKMSIYGNLGLVYYMVGEYDSARLYLNKTLSLPGGKEHEGGRMITNLANTYGFQGRYAEALKYYLEALKTSEGIAASKKDRIVGQNNIIRTIANLAEVYYLTGNRKQALYYAERGKELFFKWYDRSNGIVYVLPQLLYIAGSAYLDNNELDKAEAAMRETYEFADSIARSCIKLHGSPLGMYMYVAYGQEGLARVALAHKDYEEASARAAEALGYSEKHGDPTVTAKMLSMFSDIYMARGNYKESGRFAQKALDMYPDYAKLNPATTFNIASASLFAGNMKDAFDYFQSYSARMKENTDKQFRETMAGMEVLYETEKKEMRISELEWQKYTFAALGAFCLVLAIAIGIFSRQKIINERKDKQIAASTIISEWEKKERSRFSRELHDGINGRLSAIRIELDAMNNLQSVCLKLDDCIQTIRNIARGLMPNSLERHGLRFTLESYCNSFPNANFYFFGEDKRISPNIEIEIYYCACELLNNSIRHSGAKNINMQLIQERDSIYLTVHDDGCGFDPKIVAEGVGLENIRARVFRCNGKIDINASPGNGSETNIEVKIKS